MKKFALSLALFGAVALQGCNQQPPAATEETAAASGEVKLESFEQRLSYGIAFSVGQRMAADNIPLDSDAFLQGIDDALKGQQPRLTPEEMQQEMQTYQQQVMAERAEAQQALAGANQAAAETFLAENAAREGVVVTESGLQYEVLEAGEGAKPGADDTVEVHYRGTLVDGTEFDSSYSRGEPVTFGVGQVIAGWTEALQLMSVGSKYKLAIPADLAYGAGGAGQVIGPNAALLFEVELLSIPSQAEGEAEEEAEAPAEGEG
ncbi:MAG: FKBP-type peptidyl-prolyl cis-trans isomerase [Halioglobus sp.]|nr:FKBP-type peptidyl-prolyl cis-trans isomerase [Halioglobus sp.]